MTCLCVFLAAALSLSLPSPDRIFRKALESTNSGLCEATVKNAEGIGARFSRFPSLCLPLSRFGRLEHLRPQPKPRRKPRWQFRGQSFPKERSSWARTNPGGIFVGSFVGSPIPGRGPRGQFRGQFVGSSWAVPGSPWERRQTAHEATLKYNNSFNITIFIF